MPVPWAQILQWVPSIVEVSRELMARTRRGGEKAGTSGPEGDGSPRGAPASATAELAPRIAILEDNERRQAELVNRMAEQTAKLSAAIVELHRDLRRLTLALAAVAAVSLVTVGVLLARS